jgi:glycosyltransferase involved in cell wall biosynthesis
VDSFTVYAWRVLNREGTPSTLIMCENSEVNGGVKTPFTCRMYKKEYKAKGMSDQYHNLNVKHPSIQEPIERTDAIISSFLTVKTIKDLASYGKPVVVFIHGYIMSLHDFQDMKKLLEAKAQYPNIKVVAVSSFLMNKTNRRVPGLVDHYINPYVFDCDTSNYAPPMNNERKLVYVGRFYRDKDPWLAEMAARILNIPLWYIGTREQVEVDWCKENKLADIDTAENTNFNNNLGFMPREEIFKWYRENNCVLIVPSWETFGFQALEAQMHGVPVVHVHKNEGSGLFDFNIPDQTGVFINSHRVSDEKCARQIAMAAKKAFTLDREFIYNNARKYNSNMFYSQIKSYLESL